MKWSRPFLTRRLLLGAAGLAAAGAMIPGFPLWRALKDQSVRTFRTNADWVEDVGSVRFFPDGRTLLASGYDYAARSHLFIWDIGTGEPIAEIGGDEACFSPDGHLALFSGWKMLELWDVAGRQKVRSFSGISGSVDRIAFSPNGKAIISSGLVTSPGLDRYELKLWDVASGENILTFMDDSEKPIFSIAVAPDGRTAMSGSQELRLWDVATGMEIFRLVRPGDQWIDSVGYSADGGVLWAVVEKATSQSKCLKLWDVSTGKEIRTFPSDYAALPYSPYSIHMSPDRRFALAQFSQYEGRAAGRNARVLFDLGAGTEKVIDTHVAGIEPVAWSPDGRSLLGVGDRLRLWDLATGGEINSFGADNGITELSFLPDNRTALSAGSDRLLTLWDVLAGSKMHEFTGHTGRVGSIAVAQDGRTALSAAGLDVKLWDFTKVLDRRSLSHNPHSSKERDLSAPMEKVADLA